MVGLKMSLCICLWGNKRTTTEPQSLVLWMTSASGIHWSLHRCFHHRKRADFPWSLSLTRCERLIAFLWLNDVSWDWAETQRWHHHRRTSSAGRVHVLMWIQTSPFLFYFVYLSTPNFVSCNSVIFICFTCLPSVVWSQVWPPKAQTKT